MKTIFESFQDLDKRINFIEENILKEYFNNIYNKIIYLNITKNEIDSIDENLKSLKTLQEKILFLENKYSFLTEKNTYINQKIKDYKIKIGI